MEPANYVEIVTYTILEIREICVYLFLGTIQETLLLSTMTFKGVCYIVTKENDWNFIYHDF